MLVKLSAVVQLFYRENQNQCTKQVGVLLLLLLFIFIFLTLGIQDPDGFGNRKIRN